MLPPKPAPESLDTPLTYGGRLFAFVLATEVTATLDTSDLELALHTSQLPLSPDTTPDVRERIARTRALIFGALRGRQADAARAATAIGKLFGGSENEGPMAPLEPTPVLHPPSGAKVEIPF